MRSDRGLYAPWRAQQIAGLGWHAFLRINQRGKERPVQEDPLRPLATLVGKGGRGWCGELFERTQEVPALAGLARWEERYKEGRRVSIEMAPEQAEAVWDGRQGKVKQESQDDRPRRGSTALAGNRWCFAVGGQCRRRGRCQTASQHLRSAGSEGCWAHVPSPVTRPRLFRCLACGLRTIIGALIGGKGLVKAALLQPGPPVLVPLSQRRARYRAAQEEA